MGTFTVLRHIPAIVPDHLTPAELHSIIRSITLPVIRTITLRLGALGEHAHCLRHKSSGYTTCIKKAIQLYERILVLMLLYRALLQIVLYFAKTFYSDTVYCWVNLAVRFNVTASAYYFLTAINLVDHHIHFCSKLCAFRDPTLLQKLSENFIQCIPLKTSYN